ALDLTEAAVLQPGDDGRLGRMQVRRIDPGRVAGADGRMQQFRQRQILRARTAVQQLREFMHRKARHLMERTAPAALGFEPWPDRNQSFGSVASSLDLAFGEVAEEYRYAVSKSGFLLQLSKAREKGVRAVADQGVQDEIRLQRADVLDDVVELGVAERKVAIGQNVAAGCSDALARDLRHFPAPDVVGAEEIGAAAERRQRPVEQRQQMLVRARVHVGDMFGCLETLVRDRVPEDAVKALKFRDHFLAARRGDAAEDVARFGRTQDLAAERRVAVEPTFRVTLDDAERDVEAGVGVHFLDALQHTRIGATRQGGVDAAAREQNAYVNDPLHAVPKVKNPAPTHARRAVGTGLGC